MFKPMFGAFTTCASKVHQNTQKKMLKWNKKETDLSQTDLKKSDVLRNSR